MNSCNVGMVNEVDGKDGLVSKNLEALEFNYAEFTEHLGWCFVAELMRCCIRTSCSSFQRCYGLNSTGNYCRLVYYHSSGHFSPFATSPIADLYCPA